MLLGDDSRLEAKYKKGVGGWLLLFCLGLTIFGPLWAISNLTSGYSDASPYFDRFPGLLTTWIINVILGSGLMIFSIYAGIALWSTKSNAVRTAKAYLLVFLGYSVFAVFLPFLAGLPSEANEAMIPKVAKGAFRRILYFAVWYSYLNKSKRVKATYGEPRSQMSRPGGIDKYECERGQSARYGDTE